MNKKTVFSHCRVFTLTISLLVLTQVALSTDIGSSAAAPNSIPAPSNPEKEDILKSVPSVPDELKVKEVTDNAPAPIDPIISPGQQGALKTAPITNSLAPSVPPDPATNADKEAVLAQVAEPNAVHPNVAQLEKRIAVLEDEVQALLAKQGKPSQVKAPFEVVDSDGRVMLRVSNDAKADMLYMGSGLVLMNYTAEQRGRVIVSSSGGRAIMNAEVKSAEIMVESAKYTTRMGSGPNGEGNGFFVRDAGGVAANGSATPTKPLAEIAALAGKKVALRLYDDAGNAVVSAGTNPAAAGAGTVKVANTKGEPVAFLGTSEDGESGALGVAKNGKNTAALLSDPRMVVLYNDAGEAITTLAKSQEGTGEGGNITIRQPDGEGIFSAGYNAELGGGDACVYRAKKQNVFCLGIAVPGMGTGH
ncbi:hypothetical protein HMY34_13415 [Thiothrix subterranea]|uniref:hypothetical protein n=1 Tax=Thiothrix subterranea TaxID=2735563 RepID=UPI00192B0B86|nr:hypothetical protein [Thiothrix subterranea]QQZ29689.1 hypothetical protein HMY34_13415 [Thiothrix subterranea]